MPLPDVLLQRGVAVQGQQIGIPDSSSSSKSASIPLVPGPATNRRGRCGPRLDLHVNLALAKRDRITRMDGVVSIRSAMSNTTRLR